MTNDLFILSKDSDFHRMSFLFGALPTVIWIRRGNSSTGDIEALMHAHHAAVLAFESDPDATYLALN